MKVSRMTYLFLLLVLGISFKVSAQDIWAFDEPTKNAYRDILKLKLKAGRAQLDVIPSGRNSPAKLYLQSFAETIEVLISGDKDLFDDYEANAERHIKEIDAIKTASPYQLYYQAEIKLQWAFVYIKFGKELDAALNLRQCYRLLTKNQERYPEFLPNYKSLGLMHIVIGSVPDKYQWLLDLIGLEGTIDQGMQELSKLEESSSVFNLEAALLKNLMKAYILHRTKEAVESLDQIVTQNDDNLLALYLYVSALLKDSQSETALELLRKDGIRSDTYIDFAFLDYLKGEIYLQKGEYDVAILYLNKFIESFKGANSIKDAHYKIFLAYWLSDRIEEADVYFQKAKRTGKRNTEADKHAAKMLASGQRPNKPIMKIRLSTDGGYYEIAKQLIEELNLEDLKEEKDRIEFQYRQARLHHKTGELNKAVSLYTKTIENAGKNPWYFAPNSALQLGYIYLDLENKEAAKKYFKLALTYRNHEYKTSIDNKAKSALSSLKKEIR
ncbi:MAG: hypothetical protein AAFX87_05790 [Bacteroidota bacterium]